MGNFIKGLSLIYDGQCAFCLRSLRIIKRLDTFGALEFYDSRDQETLGKKFPMVRREDTEEVMIAVTEDLRAFKGFYAFRRLIWTGPWLWLLVPLFYFPGSAYLGTRFYAWVARNRGSLGCRSESCEDLNLSVPPASQEGPPTPRGKDKRVSPL